MHINVTLHIHCLLCYITWLFKVSYMAKTKAGDKIHQAVVKFETRHAGNAIYLNDALVSPLEPSGYYMYRQV